MRSQNHRVSIFRAIALVAMLAVAAIGSTAAAQESDTYALGVVVVNCDVNAPQQITVPEDGCGPAVGIEFNASDADGNIISTCVSAVASTVDSFTAGCALDVPFGSTVTVSQNLATVPTGYSPIQNVQDFDVPDAPITGFVGGPVFVNMLQDGAESVVDSGPVVELPQTGSGTSATALTAEFGAMLLIGISLMSAAALTLRCRECEVSE